MSLPEVSTRRPVAVFVTTLAVGMFGWLALDQLSVELLPELTYPTLTIQTEFPDAAPLTVEQLVTRPIEETVGVIPGIRDLRSVSRAGLSEVVLEFEWDERMEHVAMEAREKVGLVDLPDEVDPPRVLRFDPSLDPVMRLAFHGDRPLAELRQLADRWVKPRLESIEGVAAAKVRGGFDPEVQVDADEDRLAALGLTLDDLAIALRAENINRPGGRVRDYGAVYLVRTLHEFEDLDQIRRTVIRDGDGGRVRVEDVATVGMGHIDRTEVTRFGGQEIVELALNREGSSNTTTVADAIRERLDEVRAELPDDLTLTVLSDQSTFIAESIDQVWSAALIGGVLAVLILFFFLRDGASTAVIAISIPVSVIVTFLPVYRMGVTLNIMSLGGLALGVGMLVDNSIVVLEAIDRHRRDGLARAQAAARGAREVAGAVTAATATTVAVFLPIVFVEGIAGQLFYDLAVTVCCSLLASLVVSLSLIPMLASLEPSRVDRTEPLELWRMAKRDDPVPPGTIRLLGMRFHPPGRGRFARVVGMLFLPLRIVLRVVLSGAVILVAGVVRTLMLALWVIWQAVSRLFSIITWPLTKGFDGLSAAYPHILRAGLKTRWVLLPAAFALLPLCWPLLSGLGTSLVPDLSQGEFAFRLRMAEGTTLESTNDVVDRIEALALRESNVERIFSVVGAYPSSASGRQTTGENLAQIDFVLREEIDAANEAATIDRLRNLLAESFPAVEAEIAFPSMLTVRPPVAVQIFADELDELDASTETVFQAMSGVAGLRDIASTVEPGHPEIAVDIDRERAASLGVRADALALSLRRQIQGVVVGQFRDLEERVDIRLRARAAERDRASSVERLRFRLESGEAVPVTAVADVRFERGPAAVHRNGGARMHEVTAKLGAADLAGTLDDVRATLADVVLPPGTTAQVAGQDEELRTSYQSLQLALGLAIFMVYVVMAVQFESLKHPFVILLSVPLGAVGVILALWLTHSEISVLAAIGAVMLAGIVVNNAIVLVDAINRRRRSGEALEEAIVGAGGERLRPIVMTTATTVLALLPMALGAGAGDELRRPLAITVIGGLLVSTLLTLFVIPCLYRALAGRSSVTESLPQLPGEPATQSAGETR